MTMPIGTWMAALALLLVVAALIAQPLLGARRQALVPESELTRLERDRLRIVAAMRELDFDLRTGKLAAEDHARLRAALQVEGAETLRQIEAVSQPESAPAGRAGRDIDAEIERAVAEVRARPSSALKCPACGGAVSARDRYCPACGAKRAAR